MKRLIQFLALIPLFAFFLTEQAYALEPIKLSPTFVQADLLKHAEFLRADRNSLLSDVLLEDDWQSKLNSQLLQDDESLWLRVPIYYTGGMNRPFLVSISNPNLDYLDMFLLDEKRRILSSLQVGAMRDFSLRSLNHRDFIFALPLIARENAYLYLKVVDDGPMVFAARIWNESELVKHEQVHLIIIGVIVGALTILCCYFLITYVMLRSPIRFWFALSNAVFLLLFLNIQGIVVQLINLGAHISALTCCLVAALMFTATKVSIAMLSEVPKYLRWASYATAPPLLIAAISLNSYWQIMAIALFSVISLLLHLLLVLAYHDRQNAQPNRIYAFGWGIIIFAAFIQLMIFMGADVSNFHTEVIFALAYMTGTLLLAVAVESHEQAIINRQQQYQSDTISSLKQFYELFRNAAEGLYTAKLDGELVTVNKAMCDLFGYSDEADMLNQITHTKQFFAESDEQKLFIGEVLKNRRVLRKEVKGKRRDDSQLWLSMSGQIHEGEGEDRYLVGSVVDITERKQSSISLEYLATHDSLTGVYNRREFEKRLASALEAAHKEERALTLLYMDLDQFKVINDTCGHKAGDMLIKQLSQQLNNTVAEKGMLARLGGDEFAVLLEDTHAQSAFVLANRILNIVRDFRFIWENRIFSLGISIGLVDWEASILTAEQILSMADGACYVAKDTGRNQIHVYSQEDEHTQRYESELVWVTQINKALKDNVFELYYQHYRPLNHKVEGEMYELLIRMRDEEGKLVPPGAFLPAAERYNLAAKIDRWVIETYFKWLAQHPEHKTRLLRCNINLSGHSLADADLKLFILNAFERHNIPYDKICFEITESMAIVKMEETLSFIKTFRHLGCSFALDDFGSGFSSYAYLKNLPVDYVKIDGSFVKDLLNDPIDFAMVSSIKDIAKAIGMKTVAEFVESADIMVELGKLGVDFAQGYGIAKPAPLENFANYTPLTKP